MEQDPASTPSAPKERLGRLVDGLEGALFASRRNGQGGSGTTALRTSIMRGLALAASLAFLVAFMASVDRYQSTLTEVTNARGVVNLTAAGFKASIRFGELPRCGDEDCWLRPDFDASDWETVPIPMNPSEGIKGRKGYDEGLRTNTMYYRMVIDVPAALVSGPEEIGFSPLSIQHAKFRVFLNGREITSGDNRSAPYRDVVISIPKAEVVSGRVVLGLKTSVQPTDIGVAHYGPAFIGPRADLDRLLLQQERETTYYLLFLLSKGSIFVIFSLLFLFTKDRHGTAGFLMFAFFATVENVFIGSMVPVEVKWIVMGFYPCRSLAILGLMSFLSATFQVKKEARRALHVAGAIGVLVVVGMAIDFGWGSGTATFQSLWAVVNAYLAIVVAAALVIGALDIRLWRRIGNKDRVRQLVVLESILALYFALIIYATYFKPYVGFDLRPAIDLAFFLYIALVSARSFGITEGQVITLESHMVEKRRMEVELQEAAEIAKAFLPKDAPQWDSIAIHYYHKPLTENSGDWFTFETSPSGRFRHFLLADITGHGVQAALVVSACKSVLASLVKLSPDVLESKDFLARYFRAVNAILYENGAGYHLATMVGLTFEPGHVHYLSAGHPSPLLMTPEGAKMKFRPLATRSNVLGASPTYEEAQLKTQAVKLGDHILTFTDGLPITTYFSVVKRYLERDVATLEPQPQALYESVKASLAQRETPLQDDDVSVVWFKMTA